MSGLAGVLRLDGGPVEGHDVGWLARDLADVGPDRKGRWDGEGVSLVHALLEATPEAAGEVQPVVAQGLHGGEVAAVFDGRLDNRAALLGSLAEIGAAGTAPLTAAATDCEILVRAYSAWGEALPRRLLGDFAFALWDARRRRLLCGRDPLGVRPFFYRVAGARLAWASVMKPLATLPGAATRPNPGMVAEYLASAITSRHETVYQGVYRLPPAHTLVSQNGTVRLSRYWRPDPSREVRHASHGEYAEHLGDTLAAAVRARLRTRGPVAAELSGGLDSSTVVGLAQRELASSGPAGGQVRPLSMVYPGEDCDESEWIDSVAQMWSLQPVKLQADPPGTYDLVADVRRTGEVPAFPVVPHWRILYQAAHDIGSRSVLNGVGGDEWLTGSEREAADMLRSGSVVRAWARSRATAAYEDTSVAAAFWRSGARPLLTGAVPASVRRRVRRRASRVAPGFPWIVADFARSVSLGDRLTLPDPPPLRALAQADLCHTLESGPLAAACETLARFTGGFGIEPRMPFLDLRVAELALAVPEAERWGGAQPKRLLRAAARGIVPEALAARSDKPGPHHLVVGELLAPAVAPYLGASRIEALGWVRPGSVKAMHERLLSLTRGGGSVASENLWPLWRAVAVELWLDAAFPP